MPICTCSWAMSAACTLLLPFTAAASGVDAAVARTAMAGVALAISDDSRWALGWRGSTVSAARAVVGEGAGAGREGGHSCRGSGSNGHTTDTLRKHYEDAVGQRTEDRAVEEASGGHISRRQREDGTSAIEGKSTDRGSCQRVDRRL